MKLLLALFYVLSFGFLSSFVHADDFPGLTSFIDEMVGKHQFKRDELVNLFNHAHYRQDVIDAINRPATIKPWTDYRAGFVNKKRISDGVVFWRKHNRTLRRASAKYGVPPEIIVAIIGVETNYGKNAGTFRAIDALSTLAFNYPRRAVFFHDELENFLLLARDQDFDLLSVRSSYAGALGIPQFMPSSYRNYAIDFNGDRKIDLMNEDQDAIGSVANYMKQYGWVKGQPITRLAKVSRQQCAGDISAPRTMAEWAQSDIVPRHKIAYDQPVRLMDFTVSDGKQFWFAFNNFDVLTKYNNSDFYAMSVFQLAEAIKAAR